MPGIAEWNPVVWTERFFALDAGDGERWYGAWDERDALAERAAAFRIDAHALLIVRAIRVG